MSGPNYQNVGQNDRGAILATYQRMLAQEGSDKAATLAHYQALLREVTQARMAAIKDSGQRDIWGDAR